MSPSALTESAIAPEPLPLPLPSEIQPKEELSFVSASLDDKVENLEKDEPKTSGVQYACGGKSAAQEAFTLLNGQCAGCHSTYLKKRGGISLFTKNKDGKVIVDREGIKKIVESDGVKYPVITPKDPDKSFLVYSITGTDTDVGSSGKKGFGTMPQGLTPFNADQIKMVRDWITAGMPDPGASDRKIPNIYNEIDIIKAVHAVVEAKSAAERPYLRFFYLPSYNNSEADECALQQLRAELSLIINGLHWKKGMVHPRPVDKKVVQDALPAAERARFNEIDQVLYQIDLRDIGADNFTGKFKIVNPLWDIAWRSIDQKESLGSYYANRGIEASYPYNNAALYAYDHDAKKRQIVIRRRKWTLSNLALRVYYQTGSFVPFVRADWFVNESRRALYSQLLGLPGNTFELESALGVNVGRVVRQVKYWDSKEYVWKTRQEVLTVPIVGRDFVLNRLRRSGRTRSDVTVSNRIVDIHDTCLGGKYWISYDFKAKAEARDIVQRPLGPEAWQVFSYNILQKNLKFNNIFGKVFFYRDSKYQPYEESVAFAQDGGEIIWELPNGLHAYYVVNGLQEQLHEVPEEVAFNPANADRRDAENPVINGSTCMYCHDKGIIPYEDNVQGEIRKSDLYTTNRFWVLDPSTQYFLLRSLYTAYKRGYGSTDLETQDLKYVAFFDEHKYTYNYNKYISFKSKVDLLFARLGDFKKSEGELYSLQLSGKTRFLAALRNAVRPFVGSTVEPAQLGNLFLSGASRYYRDVSLNTIAAELGITDKTGKVSPDKVKQIARLVPSITGPLQMIISTDSRNAPRSIFETSVLWRDLSKWLLVKESVPQGKQE